MIHDMPFCEAPIPGEPGACFNLDPWVLGLLCLVAAWHHLCARQGRLRLYAAAGWLVAAAAFVSPLCALSVSLFCAGVAQRLILMLVAAPLLAIALPPRVPRGAAIWSSAATFLLALWFWHIPRVYDATFTSEWIYWSMHVSLLGSAVLLWRELLHHPLERSADAVAAGALTFAQMALLGFMLTVGDRPLFKYHMNGAQLWNIGALQDQHLGGLLIGAPAALLLVGIAARALLRSLTPARAGAPSGAASGSAAGRRGETLAADYPAEVAYTTEDGIVKVAAD